MIGDEDSVEKGKSEDFKLASLSKNQIFTNINEDKIIKKRSLNQKKESKLDDINQQNLETKNDKFKKDGIILKSVVERWESEKGKGLDYFPFLFQIVIAYQEQKNKISKSKSLPNPRELDRIIFEIEKSCNLLISNLEIIHGMAFDNRDPFAKNKNEHIAWIDVFIHNSIARKELHNDNSLQIASSTNLSGTALDSFLKTGEFCTKLKNLEVTAKLIREKKLNKRLLARKTGAPKDPALPALVLMAIPAWEGLSKRTASISSRNIASGDFDPPFVQFIQQLVTLGGGPKPTRKQVASAMPKIRPQLQEK